MSTSNEIGCLRSMLGAVVLAFSALLASSPAKAEFPERTINMLVPFSVGGSGDLLARMIARHFHDAWGQPVVVQNRAGAGGQIATVAVAKSPADGYTIALTSSGTLAVNPHVYKNLPYDPVKDFEQVTILTDLPFLLVVGADSPFRSFDEVIAKAKAAPGKITMGNAGVGSHQYLAAIDVAKQAGVTFNMVPYKGSGEMVAGLFSREIDAALDNVLTQNALLVQGKTRALATSASVRLPHLPDVPTFREKGIEIVSGFYGLALPAGTPKAIVDKFYAEALKFARSPEVAERLSAMGIVATLSTPAETTARIAREVKALGEVARTVGLVPQ